MHLGLPLCRGRLTVTHLMDKAYVISILSFYAEGDKGRLERVVRYVKFQSSPSIQRETAKSVGMVAVILLFQSSPSIQRETVTTKRQPSAGIFQSSPSIQRETSAARSLGGRLFYFNPLPLYRGRPELFSASKRLLTFQSSPSIQRETDVPELPALDDVISILSLYTEGDIILRYAI